MRANPIGFGALLCALTWIVLVPETATSQSAADGRLAPRAIVGAPSSATHCVSADAANVHSIGWVEAGSRLAITFEGGTFAPLTAVARLELSGTPAAGVAFGNPDLQFTTSSAGTMALHVVGRRQPGCYRYKVEIQSSSTGLESSEASTAVVAKPAKIPSGPLAISGLASSAKHCIAGNYVSNVHGIGRIEEGSQVRISVASDFDPIAGVTLTNLETQRGTYLVDDDSGGALEPLLSFNASQAGTLALYVAGVNGRAGCYQYKVEITAPAGAPAPAPTPAPPPPAPPPPASVSFTGVWRGRMVTENCTDDGVFEGVCADNQRWNLSLTLSLVQTGSTVTGTMDTGGVVARMSGSATGNRLNISGRAAVTEVFEVSFEDWDSTISGNTMTGTFSMRFFPRQSGVQGGAKWTQRLTNVVRGN